MNSFPIYNRPHTPDVRLGGLNPRSRFTVFVLANRHRTNRQFIHGLRAFFELCRRRISLAFCVLFVPIRLSKVTIATVRRRVLGAVFFKAFAVGNAEAMLRAELCSFRSRRFDSKGFSAFLAGDFHSSILSQNSGIMTVPYRAIKLGRRGIGIELNTQYYLDGASYCETMEQKVSSPSLFDLIEAEEPEEEEV